MKIDVKIPEVGESVKEAVLVEWYHQDGNRVEKDQILFLIETDKVTLEVTAEAGGILHIMVGAGETVAVGTVVAVIETEGRAEAPVAVPQAKASTPAAVEKGPAQEDAAFARERPAALPAGAGEAAATAPSMGPGEPAMVIAPSARALMAEKGINPSVVKGTGPGERITRGDVMLYLEAAQGGAGTSSSTREVEAEGKTSPPAAPPAVTPPPAPASRPAPVPAGSEEIVRKPMSPIRQRIAERLLQARQSTAMLTTFNEIDMSRVQAMRRQFRDSFKEKYGVSLGLMSFFVKSVVVALKEIPEVNAFIEGKEIVYHNYHHIGMAVGGERGLVVPVIRHADALSFAAIEQAILDYVKKIQANKLEISDMEGGTFTISNGGVYGSLLSTPILNTPQSGILGLHKIEDRPVVVDGEIVVRPMMYVALSYDHRIVDGKGAVTFLKRVKECMENPERIMMEV